MNNNNCKKEFIPIGKYLSIAHREFNSYLKAKLKDYDIDRGELPFLIALYHKEGVSQQNLCAYYQLDKAIAVRMMKKLEDQGYVVKKRNPEDLRQYKIYLTKKGEDLRPILMGIFQEISSTMTEGMDEREQKVLVKLLKRTIKNLGHYDPDDIIL